MSKLTSILGRRLRRGGGHPDDTLFGGQTMSAASSPQRRMLWADAVGGFLVCLDDEVVLGQPTGDGGPAVPLLADISRRHAVLRREAGAYVLEPLGPVTLDGFAIDRPTVLGSGHTIGLQRAVAAGRGASEAPGVRLRFTRPHALSATARIEVLSGHRSQPAADAVLLMAESCVLGPAPHSHVCCPGWRDEVILFRVGTDLRCRSRGELAVDGVPATGTTEIRPGARIEGQDFAVTVELA